MWFVFSENEYISTDRITYIDIQNITILEKYIWIKYMGWHWPPKVRTIFCMQWLMIIFMIYTLLWYENKNSTYLQTFSSNINIKCVHNIIINHSIINHWFWLELFINNLYFLMYLINVIDIYNSPSKNFEN